MKNALSLMGLFTVLSTALPNAALAAATVKKIENNTKIRVEFCDTRLRDEMRVTFKLQNDANPLMPVSKASNLFVDGKICARRDLAVAGLNTNQNIEISFDGGREVVSLGGSAAAPAPVAAAGITTEMKADGSYEIRACDRSMAVGTRISFRIGQNGIEQFASLDQNHCAVKTYQARLDDDQMVFIKGFGATERQVRLPKKVSVVQNGTGVIPNTGTQRPAPPATNPPVAVRPTAPVTTQPVQPVAPVAPAAPVDNRRVVSRDQIVQKASQSAQKYVQSIVLSLGQVEKMRANFIEGIRAAQGTINSVMPNLNQAPTYDQGREAAGASGQSEGIQAGVAEANSQAASLARNDVSAAIDQALNSQSEPNFTPRASLEEYLTNYQGVSANIAAPVTLDARLRAIDAELQARYRARFIPSNDLVLADNFFSQYLRFSDLYNTQNYRQDLVVSTYRGEKAFQAWLNGELRMISDNANAQYFNQIVDNNQVQNAAANGNLFMQTFIETYDRLLTSAWNRAVTESVPSVQEDGRNTYINVYLKLASDTGRYDQIRANFRQASVEGYRQQLASAYGSYYELAKTKAQTEALFTEGRATLTGSEGVNIESATLGDSFDVILQSLANRGVKEGQVRIVVQGIRADREATQQLGGIRRLQAATRFDKMATLTEISKADQVIEVAIAVGGDVSRASIKSTWEAAVIKLAKTTDTALAAKLLAHINKHLGLEWDSKAELVGDGYDDGEGTLLIERLANVVKAMNAAEKANIVKHAASFRKAVRPDGRPGFLNGYRGDYDSAMKILDAAGLK